MNHFEIKKEEVLKKKSFEKNMIIKENKEIKLINDKMETDNVTNIEININKESVRKFMIKSVSSVLDGFDFLTEKEKGQISLYVFCDDMIESMKTCNSKLDEFAEIYAQSYKWNEKIKIDKIFIFKSLVEAIRDCIIEILNEIYEERKRIHGI
jgi:hypothetical protein